MTVGCRDRCRQAACAAPKERRTDDLQKRMGRVLLRRQFTETERSQFKSGPASFLLHEMESAKSENRKARVTRFAQHTSLCDGDCLEDRNNMSHFLRPQIFTCRRLSHPPSCSTDFCTLSPTFLLGQPDVGHSVLPLYLIKQGWPNALLRSHCPSLTYLWKSEPWCMISTPKIPRSGLTIEPSISTGPRNRFHHSSCRQPRK